MTSSRRKVAFLANDEDHGRRLDQVLAARIPELSRRKARVLLDIGGVFVERARVKVASRKVYAGQHIEANLGGALSRATKAVGRAARARDARVLPAYHIAFEDTDLVVVDKPAGLLTAPTPESDRGNLADALRRAGRPSLYVVHRIDLGTSGLLVFAKTKRANKVLAERFREHDIEREYIAVVSGQISVLAATAREGLPGAPGENRDAQAIAVTLPVQGRRAVSYLYPETRVGALATVLRVRLETGRTHQIRLHCRHLGHPVLGDRQYGSRQPHEPPRMALHATRLGFAHPRTGEPMRFASPLPTPLQTWLDDLRTTVSTSSTSSAAQEPAVQTSANLERSVIERYVYIRLKPEHAGERDAVATKAREVLTTLPGVIGARVGVPADEHADKAWDLGIAVRFASLTDVEAYRVHPAHRAFVDDFLTPRIKVIKAWNFDIPDSA